MDNNKRERETVDIINKNSITLKKFKNDINIENIDLVELQSIGEKIGLKYNSFGEDKFKLYHRILNILKLQQVLLNEKNKENINIFNKNQIKLKNESVNNKERNFWKIFRNKFLFTKIFSNFEYKEDFSYQDINSIKKIKLFYNNSIEIIMDKIKSNQPLIQSISDIDIILGYIINNSISTQLFYKHLFSNYLFNCFSNYISNENIKKWVLKIITKSNIAAFNEFIKIYGIDKKTIQTIISDHFKKPDYYLSFNGYHEIKMISFLLKNCFLNEKFQFKISYLNFDINIKQLIKYSKNIISIYEYANDQMGKNNNQLIKNIQIKIEDLQKKQLNINLYKIFKDKLNSNLKLSLLSLLNLINNLTNDINNSMGIKDFESNIKFSEYENLLFFKFKKNLLFLFKKFKQEYIEENLYVKIFKNFGQTILNLNEEKILDFIETLNQINIEPSDELFRIYCICIISTNEIQVIDYLFNKYPFNQFFEISKIEIYKYIESNEVLDYFLTKNEVMSNEMIWLQLSNISLVEHFEKRLQNSNKRLYISISEYNSKIKPESLKRVLDNPTFYQFNPSSNITSNQIIVKYIKEFMYMGKHQNSISLLSFFDFVDLDLFFNEPWVSKSNCFKIYNWIFKDLSDEFIENMVLNKNYFNIFLIKKTFIKNEIKIDFINSGVKYHTQLHDIYSFLNNLNNGIENNNKEKDSIIFKFTIEKLFDCLCLCGRSNLVIEIFKKNSYLNIIFYKQSVEIYSKQILLEFLKYFLNDNLMNNGKNKGYIQLIILSAFRNSNIPFFNHIILYYPNLLLSKDKKQSSQQTIINNNNYSIFTNEELYFIIKSNIEREDNLELTQLLINYIDFSLYQFEEFNQIIEKYNKKKMN